MTDQNVESANLLSSLLDDDGKPVFPPPNCIMCMHRGNVGLVDFVDTGMTSCIHTLAHISRSVLDHRKKIDPNDTTFKGKPCAPVLHINMPINFPNHDEMFPAVILSSDVDGTEGAEWPIRFKADALLFCALYELDQEKTPQ